MENKIKIFVNYYDFQKSAKFSKVYLKVTDIYPKCVFIIKNRLIFSKLLNGSSRTSKKNSKNNTK